jgi:hypothetical protein
MIVFASPDWGGGAVLAVLVFIIFVAIILLALAGVVFGLKLYKSKSSMPRRVGTILVAFSVSFPVVCFLAPPYLVRFEYGNYPIGSYPRGKICEGMSQKEVETILGPPHQRCARGGREQWIYLIDSFGISWCGVDFGPDGHVVAIYGN